MVRPGNTFVIKFKHRPSKNGSIFAAFDGLRIVTEEKLTESCTFTATELRNATDFGYQLSSILPMLVEQEIAAVNDNEILIPFEKVHILYDSKYQFGLTRWLPELCPYTIQVEARDFVGHPNFRYHYSFFAGTQKVLVERQGCFLEKGSYIYCLSDKLFHLLERLDTFNNLGPEEKTRSRSLEAFAGIKDLASQVGANLDNILATTHVSVPGKVGIDIEQDDQGRVSFLPSLEGVAQDEFKQRFRQYGDALEEYELDTADGGRLRIIINDELREALSIMRKVDRLTGKDKDRVLTAPRELFEGLTNPDCVDFAGFGPRVKGIGPYTFQAKPFIRLFSPGFLDTEGADIFENGPDGKSACSVGIEAEDCDGNKVTIPLPDKDTLARVSESLTAAANRGETSIKLKDSQGAEKIIPITPALLKGMKAIEKRVERAEQKKNGDTPSGSDDSSERYLLIYDNSEELDYVESDNSSANSSEISNQFELPSCLVAEIAGKPLELKDFQRAGVAWLQRCFRSGSLRATKGRRGVLLADDMGLGKTLQLLTFMAWFIETGYKEKLGQDTPPYEPILVIAPKILIHNWKQELQRFFEFDGAVFDPYVLLHGDELKRFRIGGGGGREYQSGAASLDIKKLCSHRLVITNYDTVKNYQHSFAQVEWSAVVVDEAQEIKEPNTSVTWALKSLNALYRVAMTGTPVENSLADLWNIMDFAQPGLLGTQKEFRTQYESDLASISQDERLQRAEHLRGRLLYKSPNAYLVRRTKEGSLDGLPEKKIFIRRVPLSQEQETLHREVVQYAKAGCKANDARHLLAVQKLSKLYQHVALLEGDQVSSDAAEYLKRSPKLQEVVALLKEIRRRGEKVLIFAVFTKMQRILKLVLEKEFGLEISVINGATSGASSVGGESHRLKLIEKFSSRQGFNVMILSPDVAGVGLNIVSANNVIHYGRWWNPAKEAQATDRAYRIGQTKDVNVYLPISVSDKFASFDEKLHALLENKRQVASDFLVPSVSLEVTTKELFDGIKDSESPASSSSASSASALSILSASLIYGAEPQRFKAMVAAALSSSIFKVCLTPMSQNQGIDLVAVSRDVVRLIVCRQSLDGKSLPPISFSDVRLAENYYREHVFKEGFAGAKCELVLALDINAPKELRKQAEGSKITVLDRDGLAKLFKERKIPTTSVLDFEAEQPASMEELLGSLL